MPSETDSTERWVTLERFPTLMEADSIISQLDAAGIEAFLPDQQLMQTIAWNVNAYGFVRVQVAPHDLEAAQKLLTTIRECSVEPDDSEDSIRHADHPLSWSMRWFAFVLPVFTFPGLCIFAITKGGYTRQGCERKARELWHWFAGGIAFWIFLSIAYSFITILFI